MRRLRCSRAKQRTFPTKVLQTISAGLEYRLHIHNVGGGKINGLGKTFSVQVVNIGPEDSLLLNEIVALATSTVEHWGFSRLQLSGRPRRIIRLLRRSMAGESSVTLCTHCLGRSSGLTICVFRKHARPRARACHGG